MAQLWFYTQNGQPAAAPVDLTQLRALAAAGVLQATDEVWREGLANWVKAKQVRGLFAGADSAPAPAAPTGATPRPADSALAKGAPRRSPSAPSGEGLRRSGRDD